MAHFAELDENNEVIRVYKIGNDVSETEQDGINECVRLHGVGTYKQCSYNTKEGIHWNHNVFPSEHSEDQTKAFRKNYPGIGWLYNPDIDGFTKKQPFPSWSLNTTTGIWEAPVAYPEQTDPPTVYTWDEDAQSWVS